MAISGLLLLRDEKAARLVPPENRSGFTFGAGIEYALWGTSRPSYMDFGTSSYVFSTYAADRETQEQP